MNITDRSISETIDFVVSEFRRFSSPDSAHSLDCVRRSHVIAVAKLRGIQLLLSSIRFSRLIDQNVALLGELLSIAEVRLADVGRSSTQSAEVVE